MVKKESAQRGYMTPKEAESHLDGLQTDNEKIRYLNKVLKHEKMLSSKTREEVYGSLGNLHEKDHDYILAGVAWEKSGKPEKAAEVYEKAAAYKANLYSPENDAAIHEQAGWYEDAAKKWEKAGRPEKAEKAYEKAVEVYEKRNWHGNAIRVWEKAGRPEKAEELKGKLKSRKSTRNEDLTSKLTPVVATLGLLSGIFFLSNNITGNAIADVSTKTSSFLGAGLVVIGLVAGFFWIKRKNKKENVISQVSKPKNSKKKK